jgi:glycopeptide antibiotics resistance protein
VKTSATQKWAKPIFYIAIALALVVYGIVIELLQGSATTYRTPDVWDVLANSIGVILGSLTFLLFFKKFKGLKS